MSDKLKSIPKDRWPVGHESSNRIAVWLSDFHLVQVFSEPEGVVRLTIGSTKRKPDGNWKDGFTWDALQFIKSQVGYGAFDAMEIYPRDADVVNVANLRHLWVAPKPIAIAWRNTP